MYTISMYEKCRVAGIVKYIQVNKYILDLYTASLYVLCMKGMHHLCFNFINAHGYDRDMMLDMLNFISCCI